MDAQENENSARSCPLAPDLSKITTEIDLFITYLLDANGGDPAPPDVPVIVEQFLAQVEEKMNDYDSGDSPVKWNLLKKEDADWFLNAVDRVSSLSKSFSKFSSESKYAYSINRAGNVLQRAMAYLEEEFKILLEEYKIQHMAEADHGSGKNDSKSKQFVVSTCSTSNQESDAADGSSVMGYSEEIISHLSRIAEAMIGGGYQSECCHVYIVVRREALEEHIVQNGLEKHSIDDIHKRTWESLEREIELWILRFTNLAKMQFTSERKLSDSVFSGHPSISESIFRCLVSSISKQILKFAEAVALTRRSPDKLFKYLTVYETVREVINGTVNQLGGGVAPELKNEAWMIRTHLGEAMISILNEVEISIKNDQGKNPVPGGAVHPLTTYIMNYLEYTAIYKKTLEQVYLEHQKLEDAAAASEEAIQEEDQSTNPAVSPFQAQILKIMNLLDSNIEAKSKFYKDQSLSSIFMMNNGRYMLKKIKKSNELHSILGETWYRKMSSDLRNYHKGYQRETWGKLLGFLNPEGLTGSNKHVKPILKDRFKSFNNMFDEIRKTQTNWVISDEQLQSELRVSISNMVVPAYRSFLSRYSQIFKPGRQTEKHIKHQPEDVEAAIECLFSGTPTSKKKM